MSVHEQALKAAKEAFQRTDDVEIAMAAYLRMMSIFGHQGAHSLLHSFFPEDLRS
jgi:hypothetical protein